MEDGATPEIMIPPAIVTNLSSDKINAESSTSPQDTDLLSRKMERQMLAKHRPNQLLAMELADSEQLNSPATQARLDVIKSGADPTETSSPIGTDLLQRKMARGQPKPIEESTLAGPDGR
mgnify:CR=1 FL=1|jgi:hypothetical protein|mmetsp:Transcript_67185/g.149902  ORF Transcript_67185/g.149902 Transcript_67185/m.149902 type:complete len:120 (-) Transcript_67185:616-975(-)